MKKNTPFNYYHIARDKYLCNRRHKNKYCEHHQKLEQLHDIKNLKMKLKCTMICIYITQADIIHVKFMSIELHMKFTWTSHENNVIPKWNSLNMNCMLTNHVNFTWRLDSHEFHVNSVTKFICSAQIKIMWNSCENHVKYFFLCSRNNKIISI